MSDKCTCGSRCNCILHGADAESYEGEMMKLDETNIDPLDKLNDAFVEIGKVLIDLTKICVDNSKKIFDNDNKIEKLEARIDELESGDED